jgi:hypothetical protein
MKRTCLIAWTLAVAFGFALARPADGQVVTTPGAIWNSTGGGAQGLRAPGNMVGQGLARAIEVFPQPLAFTEITEVELPDQQALILATVIDTVFSTLNAALSLLQNAIITRAGGDASSGLDALIPGNLSDLSSLVDQFTGGSR